MVSGLRGECFRFRVKGLGVRVVVTLAKMSWEAVTRT